MTVADQALTLIDPESTCRKVNECNGNVSPVFAKCGLE